MEETETKVCSKCGVEKPLSDFYKAKNKGYEYHRGDCKDCVNKQRSGKYPELSVKWKESRKIKYKNDASVKNRIDNYRRTHKEKSLLMDCRKRAKEQGLPFNITEDDIVIPEVCPVLGIKICKENSKREYNSPSVDKIIPEKGYVKGNICVISWRANMIKSCGNAEEHLRISKYITECITQTTQMENKDIDCSE